VPSAEGRGTFNTLSTVRVGVGVLTAGPSGLPTSVLETALGLARAGAEVTIFMTPDARLPPAAEALIRAPLEPLPAPLRKPRVEHGLQLAHRLLLGRRLARAVADHPVDVLHLFSPALAALLPAEPPAVVQSWFWPPTLRGRLRTMMPFARRGPAAAAHLAAEVQAHAGDRLGYRRAALVLANTRTAEEALRALGYPAQAIPPCIGLPALPSARINSDRLRIVCCAYNLTAPRKGLDLLLEALPALPAERLRLTLVGGWSERLRPAVERIERAGTEVVVMGRVPRERYLELLAHETDLLAMPSLYEEWGYALFEALSRGVPALALRRYPFAEVLDARMGVLADDATSGAVAAALKHALTGGLPDAGTVRSATAALVGADAIAPRLLEAYERVAS
jgi:glycosyltransferase involved in cell wall biosynthesis